MQPSKALLAPAYDASFGCDSRLSQRSGVQRGESRGTVLGKDGGRLSGMDEGDAFSYVSDESKQDRTKDSSESEPGILYWNLAMIIVAIGCSDSISLKTSFMCVLLLTTV